MLAKVDSSTREMTAAEEQWWIHTLGKDPLIGKFLQSQAAAGVDTRKQAMRQPVCPHCEKLAFHHKGGVACGECGYVGAEKVKLKLYLREGMYR